MSYLLDPQELDNVKLQPIPFLTQASTAWELAKPNSKAYVVVDDTGFFRARACGALESGDCVYLEMTPCKGAKAFPSRALLAADPTFAEQLARDATRMIQRSEARRMGLDLELLAHG